MFRLVISFIGFGSISLLAILVPDGENLAYPFMSIVFGLLLFLVGVNDLYSIFRCTKKIEGVYCGYNTYYGGNAVSTYAPVFEYTYNGTFYHEQTTQNISYKQLTQNMVKGNTYPIYINPKCPGIYILSKKIKIGTILCLLFGIMFLIVGIVTMCLIIPIFFELAS